MQTKVYELYTHDYSSNRYIVYSDDNDKALVIDPGLDYNVTMDGLKKLGKTLGAILITHAHFDHIESVKKLKDATGAPIYMGEKDIPLLESDGQLDWYFGKKLDAFTVDSRLIDGLIDVCGFKVNAVPTPGHTHGSLTFVIGNAAFTGDSIFFETYGRTDLPGSDPKELIEGAKRLFALPSDYDLYCGHGKNTTLDHEREFNPIRKLF